MELVLSLRGNVVRNICYFIVDLPGLRLNRRQASCLLAPLPWLSAIRFSPNATAAVNDPLPSEANPTSAQPHPSLSALEDAGWGALSDRLVAGLCHELNGRSSAMYGLAELAKSGDDATFVADSLGKEAQRMQALVRALRALSARGQTEARPVAPADRMDDLLQLFEALPGAEMLGIETHFDPQTPAVMIPWATMTRGFLLILAYLGSRALRDGHRGALSVALEKRSEGPVLTMTTLRREGQTSLDPATEELIKGSWAWPFGAQKALESVGCFFLETAEETEQTGAQPRVVIRLPPLS